jgi:hypothetical protein
MSMTPQMAIQITGKYAAKPIFDQAVADANRASGAIVSTGGRVSTAMNDAGFATSNLAAQFNDIGVMLASGQSPLLLAIQQGTQISQVLGPMKAGAAVAALKTALMSLMSPVTLITIGSIAAGAALVQWLMSAQGSAESATEAFERHRKEIEGIVAGYGAAETAVGAYFAAISRMPRGIATGQLNDAFQEIGSEVEDFRNRMADFASDGHWAKYGSEAIRAMQGLAAEFANGKITAEQFHQGLEEVKDQLNLFERIAAAIPGSTRGMLETLQEGALKSNQMANGIANLVAQSHALAGISVDADLGSFFEAKAGGVEKALEALKGATPELRTIQQIINDTYAEGMSDPFATSSGKEALTAAKDAALAAIAEAEARREAASAAGKQADAYAGVIANLDHELKLVNLSAREQEVLNNIRSAGVDASSQQGMAIRAATEALFDQQKAVEDLEKQQEQLQKTMEKLGDIGVSAIESIAGAFDDGKLSGQEMLRIVLQIGRQLSQLDWSGLAGGGGGGNWLSMLFGGGPRAASSITGSSGGFFPGLTGPSLEGGGYTGDAPRSGGVDGRGGFPAILHPQETVIDHAISSGGGTRSVEVHVHQDASHEGPPEASISSSGNVDIVRVIVGTVAQAMGEGRLDGAMKANFGVNRKPAF